MEVEGEIDRSWRIDQAEIAKPAGQEASQGQTGSLHTELQLQETCGDITFFQDQTHIALHCLNSHIEPTRLAFLPCHWLSASVGNAGYLKYQDTSAGQLLVEHRTKFGTCNAMAQNRYNPLVHLWPVVSVAMDPNSSGRYMSAVGQDGTVKIWDCRNWKGSVQECAKGSLAAAIGGTVNVGTPSTIYSHRRYMKHSLLKRLHPYTPRIPAGFCPFQDILTVSHSSGLSSILAPGSAKSEASWRRYNQMIALGPGFVGSLPLPSKLITAVNGTDNTPFAHLPRLEKLRVRGKVDVTEIGKEGGGEGDGCEVREKRKMCGKGKSMKRYLRKQRQNVVDPTAVTVCERLEKRNAERRATKAAANGSEEGKKGSALDRFKRSMV
ncbi:hypothetical protein FIBSPDRAFT_915126 [Athelia psychrophila]|uniref:BING4 C-terminal domain-containing protein n=1 Tax=Athelia psychrophila TaxID=1759441 RepID=A0A167UUA3_9AGAM|nr:hypothetical protein FIBSPDRAFT_915126 [Fibularhizoctonia sp. CBS 109695]